MKRNLDISVVVPVYNGASFIERALQNIRSQERVPEEIIVIDDGSTDNVSSLVRKYSKVTYRYQENKGPSAARNLGISISKCDVIAFLDVDDLWVPDKLKREVEILEADPSLDLVQGLVLDIDAPPIEPGYCEAKFEILSSPYAFVTIGSMVFRKTAFEKVGLFDEDLRANEDTNWFIRAWECGANKRLTKDVSVYYTIRQGSLTSKQDTNKSPLPLLLKMHRDRMQSRSATSQRLTGLKDFFVGFPDRKKRYPRNEYVFYRSGITFRGQDSKEPTQDDSLSD